MQNFPNPNLNFPKLNFTNIPKTPTFYAPITSTTYTHSIPTNPYHPISSRNNNLIFSNINSYRSILPQQLILNSYRPPQLPLYKQTTSRNANQPIPLANTSIQVNTSGNLTARSNPKRNDIIIQPGITNEIELLDIKLKCDLISHKLTKLKDIVIPTTHSNIKKFRTRNYNFEHITFKAKRTPLNYGNGDGYKRDNKSFDANINVIYHRDDNDNKEHNKLKQQKECEDLSDIVDNIVETFDVERSGEKGNKSKKSKDNNIEMVETFADVVARSVKKSESGANSFKGGRVSIGSEKKYIEDDLNMCISDDYLRNNNEEDVKLLRSGNKKKVQKKIQKKVVKTIKTPKVHIMQFKEDKNGGDENRNEEEIEGEDEEIEEEVEEEEVEIEVSDNEEQKQQCDISGNGNDKLKHKKKKRKSKDKNEIINEDTNNNNNNTNSTAINKDQGNVVNTSNINNTAVNPNSDTTNTTITITNKEVEKVKPPKEEENKKFKVEHKRAINSEEEADLIISQIMKTAQIHAEEDEIKLAQQLEEEAKEQLQQHNNTNTNTNEPVQKQVKKGVTFSDESLIKIQYKSKDIITKLEIYDINNCQLPFKPHNMSRYITLLMTEHDEEKLKPCIINSEHNSHLYSSLRSSTKSNKNKKKNLLSMNQKNMIRRNINKIQEISKRGCIYNIKSPKKKPEIKKQNCKKFITNPQHFFTEKLCDRMYSAYNLHKTSNKDITQMHNNTSSSHLTRSYSPSQLHHMHINNNNNE